MYKTRWMVMGIHRTQSLTPCQTLHFTVGAKQVELLNKTQQIVPKAGTPQEKNEEGFKIRGQGGSATKPGPNTQIIRLPPLRWHCLSQLPLWVDLPELPALVPKRKSEEQMHAAQPLSLSDVMGPAQEAIQWFWLIKLRNLLESRP